MENISKFWLLFSLTLSISTLNAAKAIKPNGGNLPKQATSSGKENSIDLIIINDIQEADDGVYLPWEIEETQKSTAITIDLFWGLLNNQLVLCPKALWTTIQRIFMIWDYTAQYPTIFDAIKAINDLDDDEKQELRDRALDEPIKNFEYSQAIQDINKKYKEINQLLRQGNQNKAKEIIVNFGKDVESKNYPNLKRLFLVMISYNIIKQKNFICKEVDDVYMLFIPTQTLEKFKIIPNGLLYQQLKDYDYQNPPKEQQYQASFQAKKEIEKHDNFGTYLLNALKKIMPTKNSNSPFWYNIYLTGHGSPDSVAEISIKTEPISSKASSNKTQAKRPTKSNAASSQLLTLFSFLNNAVNTRSLTLSSCYPGGKKYIDMVKQQYGSSHRFNNIPLEQISYPIITLGSFYQSIMTSVYVPQPFTEAQEWIQFYIHDTLYGPNNITNSDKFVRYFKALNEPTPNYDLAVYVMDPLVYLTHPSIPQNLPNRVKQDQLYLWTLQRSHIANYASIKYPHTSWFTPLEISSFSLTISNIMAQQKRSIKLKESIKIVPLFANYIQQIVCSAKINSLPVFPPMNYENQIYCIEELTLPNCIVNNSSHSFHDLITQMFIPFENIQEPINIFIEKLTTQNESYSDILIFMYQKKSQDTYVTGYCYRDPNKKLHQIEWPSTANAPAKSQGFEVNTIGSQTYSMIIEMKAFATKEKQKLLKEIRTESELKKELKTLESIIAQKGKIAKQTKALVQAEQTALKIQKQLEAKEITPEEADKLFSKIDTFKQFAPEKVRKSHQLYEHRKTIEKTSKIVDVVATINSQHQKQEREPLTKIVEVVKDAGNIIQKNNFEKIHNIIEVVKTIQQSA